MCMIWWTDYVTEYSYNFIQVNISYDIKHPFDWLEAIEAPIKLLAHSYYVTKYFFWHAGMKKRKSLSFPQVEAIYEPGGKLMKINEKTFWKPFP